MFARMVGRVLKSHEKRWCRKSVTRWFDGNATEFGLLDAMVGGRTDGQCTSIPLPSILLLVVGGDLTPTKWFVCNSSYSSRSASFQVLHSIQASS